MGEARARRLAGLPPRARPVATGGKIVSQHVRIVTGVQMQNSLTEGVTILMVGQSDMEVGIAMTPPEVDRMIQALIAHRDEVVAYLQRQKEQAPLLLGANGLPVPLSTPGG